MIKYFGGICIILLLLNLVGCTKNPHLFPEIKGKNYFYVYGNYCGPNWPPDESMQSPPKDDLDALCYAHDYCYKLTSYNCYYCDIAFTEALLEYRPLFREKRKKHNDLWYLKSDKAISDPVFQGLLSGELRRESKLEGEGIAVSAHIVFSLRPIKPRGNVYDTILEEAPGVSMSRLTPFLLTEFGAVSDFPFKFEGKVSKSRPRIRMSAKISKNFREDIEAGVFRGIILEKYEVKDFMDEESIMKTSKKAVTLTIENSEMAAKARSNPTRIIKNIFRQAKLEGYDNVVVKYQNENKRSRTVNIDTKLKEAMDVIVAKSKAIELEKNVDQCEAKFNNEILGRMRDWILSIRNSREEVNSKK